MCPLIFSLPSDACLFFLFLTPLHCPMEENRKQLPPISRKIGSLPLTSWASVQYHWNQFCSLSYCQSCLMVFSIPSFLACLCICGPEVPFQMDTNCRGCTLLGCCNCPRGSQDLLFNGLIDKGLSLVRSSWSKALAHQGQLNTAA